MSQRQAPYTVTAAFPEPNYTQTPNNFFEMLPDMEASEILVTLIMIRNTFGFHRNGFKMGISKLEKATGLSRNAVKDGAESAEKRGTFRRTNPDQQGEAEWELVVGQSMTPLTEIPLPGQSVTPEGSISDPQVRVKESNKENKTIPLSIENTIYLGLPVTDKVVEHEKLRNLAPRMFERALGFSKPLPWWNGKDWTAFAEWVCAEYEKSIISFGEYNIWRNTPYTKGGMANTRIRGFVTEFYDSWDMFMMNKKPAEVYTGEKRIHAL